MTIKELRLSVADTCPYSCVYCNIYIKKINKGKKQDIGKDVYIVGNESTAVLLDSSQKRRLSLTDYSFLLTELRNSFGLEDVTFTGGDPFTYPHIKSLINLANSLGLRTTAITKGAPLFSVRTLKQAQEKLGNLSRVIISLDIMDKKKYAQTNLPLISTDIGETYLPKTLSLIKRLVKFGYRVDVNSVLMPCMTKEECNSIFNNLKKIVTFCNEAGVARVKFIELDSAKTLGNPYIENYFKRLEVRKFLKPYGEQVVSYRTHCPQNFIDGRKVNKLCEFSHGGELHLNQYGQSLLCQKDSQFNLVDLSEALNKKNQKQLISKIKEINKKIIKQKCSFYDKRKKVFVA